MDETVSRARFFADGNGQTLLITTGDHETGGLTVEATDEPEYPDESGGRQGDPNANLSVEDGPFRVANSAYRMILDRTTTAHTGADVPLTASGPGGRDLVGNYQNTHVYDAMAGALGFPRAQRSKPAD